MVIASEVQPRDEFKIWLRFSDGTEGVVDLSDLAGRGVFCRWLESGIFDTVHVDADGAIAWDGGLELCPDSLYLKLTGRLPFSARSSAANNANA